MEHLPLIILVLIVGTLSIVVDRRIQARRAAQQAAAAAPAEQATSAPATETQGAGLGQRLRFWQRPLTPQPPADPLQPFRVWAVETFADQPEVRHWLAALPDPALKAFLGELTIFCQQLGFELDWVVGKQVNQYPVLTQRLRAIILQYSNACREAVLAQDEIKVFKAWQAFELNPYGKEEQQFAEKLFNQLVAQNVTQPLTETLKTGPEQERQIYIVQILRQEREKQPIVFQQALNTVVNRPASLSTTDASQGETKRRWFKKATPAAEATPA
ncbi:MAG: hypothetical protein U0350_47550 [Caldilineaceae bacterium]